MESGASAAGAGRAAAPTCARLAVPLPTGVARGFHKRSSMTERSWRVRRRCLVCEAEAEVTEPVDTDEIGPLCGVCHAPTERVAVLEQMSRVPNPHAAALGRLGGLRGGPARAAALTARRRREIARAAALARWKKS